MHDEYKFINFLVYSIWKNCVEASMIRLLAWALWSGEMYPWANDLLLERETTWALFIVRSLVFIFIFFYVFIFLPLSSPYGMSRHANQTDSLWWFTQCIFEGFLSGHTIDFSCSVEKLSLWFTKLHERRSKLKCLWLWSYAIHP